jgi:hypothetical protein
MLNNGDIEVEACQRLWRSVIFVNVRDAIHNAYEIKEDDRRRARGWIMGFGKDFRDVCYLAGMNPLAVREKVRTIMDKRKAQEKKSSKRKENPSL